MAVNAPLSRLFDYLPAAGTPALAGMRVRVPFGRRTRTGIVMAVGEGSDLPADKLRNAIDVLDAEPLFSGDDLWLLRFTSDYYHHPIGEVAAAAMPALLRQGRPLYATIQQVAATPAAADADVESLERKAPKQAELLRVVLDAGTLPVTDLDQAMQGWRRVSKGLIDKGLIDLFETSAEVRDEEPLARVEQIPGPTLNADQRAAVREISAAEGFEAFLLDGVTGSGKTEVYLHLIRSAIDAGRQVLVIVPEIGLTPQLVRRFRERLGIEPDLLHSALTDAARLAAWRSARDGTAPLVVGTRSAIFVPLKHPGLILVDEEHDTSLKQQEGLRYSARDLAVARAKRAEVPVVLGSATPSLDSLERCRTAGYRQLLLPSRAGKAVPPLMRLVDMNRYQSVEGLSEPVVTAIGRTVARGAQVLIFLNRRGYAPTLICTGCGKVAECERCDARMTVHAASHRLRCHHCGAEGPMETECVDCGPAWRPLGHGTERLEEALQARFPGETVTRIDSDSTRLKGTMTSALAMATSGETRILVGTQMLSKGHHFPNLALVAVINADQGLFSTDFRGGERLAQSIVQVAGRAGREARQGEVIIQTAFPDHPFWHELLHGGYHGVAERALSERERTLWPPFSRLALIRASATRREEAHGFLERARQLADRAGIEAVRILGPVGAPMERRAGRYRAQLLLQSRDRAGLHRLLGYLREHLEGIPAARRVRWSIDVDPIELF